MSGFSAEWLALREPSDHRARNRTILAALQNTFAARQTVSIVDLGCGTGSNLRATAPFLPEKQEWLLIDHDLKLLEAARTRLAAWADAVEDQGGGLKIKKGRCDLVVAFRQADLAADLEDVLAQPADLVTAAALFDLVSIPWIDRFARTVGRQRAAFYTTLTYDGVEIWQPPHPADSDILAAFNAHQTGDKGFGPSAGPASTETLVRDFLALGYDVKTGQSPSHLGPDEAPLVRDVAECVVQAARETGEVSNERLADWLTARLAGASCTIGHTDLLAIPR
jgi:SAM-dependent methyltransferase